MSNSWASSKVQASAFAMTVGESSEGLPGQVAVRIRAASKLGPSHSQGMSLSVVV